MNPRNSGQAASRLNDTRPLKEKLIIFFTKWEVLLCVIFLFQGVLFSSLTPYFLDSFNLMNANFTFMEKAVVALPMILVIMSGDIDISVASIIALSSFALGAASEAGASVPQLILTGILVGVLAGAFNGFFVSYVGMPAIAVTLATQSLFRGIPQAFLGDQAYTSYPESFGYFGQGFVGDTIIPFELVLFLFLALIMWFVLHQSSYGRKVYALGNSKSAARFSGVNVERIRFINFVLNGLFCGIAAVMLTSRIGSTRPNIAFGWDMEVITLVVLGGVSISGGKGNIFGVIVSVFLLGYLKFGMGLLNISGKIMIITTGLLLVIAVLLPMLLEQFRARRKLNY
ncbi:ABC transporter permease [Marispirochaeta aestuarii]|uniref:ABC transporter permease n=1 Tax=Marispirochaeta aestuarii TaxID=1963862 RepID=UPI0029C86DD3|nr:ABC transporter permease [Marispirochaeta aestuarii]